MQRTYPWDQWLNGERWSLRAGVDYQCGTATLRTMAHRAADRRRGYVETSLAAEVLSIQFFAAKPADDAEQAWRRYTLMHIAPSRLCRMALKLDAVTENDQQHLAECATCSRALEAYQAGVQ